ncbi:extracellular solute-binding protein [Actinotalea ferrariae]|uniref:extracellular solute-binding protein n=1 Tax=Actinotalea ferrariae TaxID=1386098 RepID=UPI001C8C9564|nr:extracellular solute-binding protein [Actinotalea ferrariae]MBX9245316.1 extracellular solute-binding protein [Actinotalea ferrariae]
MKSSAVRSSVLVAVSGVVLAACAQGTTNDDGGGGEAVAFDPEAELSGNLSIMGFGLTDEIGEVRYEAAQEALGDDVELSLVEGDLDIQQFLSAVAAGDPPALVYANRDQIGTFASRGAIIPLDACIEGEGIDTSVFREPSLNQVTFNDSVYGIPEFNQVQITMANASLLEAAGLGIEAVNGSDWEAVTSATTALTQGNGGSLSVIGYDSKLPEFLPLWARSNGVDLLSEDGRTAQLDDPAVIEALEFAVGIYDQQGGFGAVKAFRDSADFFGEGNQFATGVLGAMPMENWYVNVLNEVSSDAPMAFDSYRSMDGEPIAFAGGSAWAVPAGTEDTQAAACRFMRTMTATDTWMEAAQARVDARAEEGLLFTGLLTGNAEADDRIRSELMTEDAPEPWASAIDAIYEANENSFTFPANPADAEFKTAWQDGVNRVLNGQATPAESMAQAQEEAQAALDEAWAEWDDDQE